MRALYTTLFFLISGLLTLQAQADVHVCKNEHALQQMEQAAAARKLAFRSSPFTDNYDIKYHRLSWVIDPAVNYIQGEVTTYFVPTQDNFTTLYFDMEEELQVNQIIYHGQPVNAYTQQDKRIAIEFPFPLANGLLDSITIAYEGVPPNSSGFGSFIQSSHAGVPIIWTLSEPYGARDWWPCKQDLNDKIDSIDVYVKTPAEYRAAGNGLLVEELTEPDGDITYHWKHRYPIPAYLIAIAVTNYEAYSDFVPVDGGEPIEVLNYVFPESANYAQDATTATVDIMQLFNELFGLYPFAAEKYGHAQFGWGGGMEHQTMSFMGGFSHLLQAHELAHQWFGNKVTCGSWQDIWLNEGFATYLEGLTYDYGLGPNTFPNWLQGKINHVTSEPGGSVYVTDTSSVGRIFSSRLSYSKGAMLLHMLRWKLGDEDFYQAARNYLNAPELAFGYARSEDLQFYLEQQSGQELEAFFADWLYGEGYPSYEIDWYQDGNTVYVKIEQATSHPSVDFFEMPVPVRFTLTDGDTITRVFDHQFSGQVFSFTPGEQAVIATFDPELWILSTGNQVSQEVFTHAHELQEAQINLFPNPAQDHTTLQLPTGLRLRELRLLHADGRLARRYTPAQRELRLQGLPPGAYLLHLLSEKGSRLEKIMIK